METRILSASLEDGDLTGAIQAIANFLKVDCTIETRVLLSTESKKLIEMVDVLTGSKPDNKPIAVEEKSVWPRTTRTCQICGESFSPRRKDQNVCGKPECKKARQSKYNMTRYSGHLTRKQIKSIVPTAEVSPDPVPLAHTTGPKVL